MAGGDSINVDYHRLGGVFVAFLADSSGDFGSHGCGSARDRGGGGNSDAHAEPDVTRDAGTDTRACFKRQKTLEEVAGSASTGSTRFRSSFSDDNRNPDAYSPYTGCDRDWFDADGNADT